MCKVSDRYKSLIHCYLHYPTLALAIKKHIIRILIAGIFRLRCQFDQTARFRRKDDKFIERGCCSSEHFAKNTIGCSNEYRTLFRITRNQ